MPAEPGARAPAAGPRRPVLFVTNHVPPDRLGAFAALNEREGIELALFGGRSHHATAGVEDVPVVPYRRIDQRRVFALAGSRRYRAVVCGTAGRIALPAAWRGARRAGVPFLLWSALWADVRTPAHLAAWPLMAAIYRDADVVVAYGEHVAAFARRRGARRTIVAPQAVDRAFWSAPVDPRDAAAARLVPGFQVLFTGRDVPEKGLSVLHRAWPEPFVVLGATTTPPAPAIGVGPQPPAVVRNFYAASDVLVVPSLPTRSFREPWGLVINEAMDQHLPIIASDAVGAAAGGLVSDGRTGLVVPAGDVPALAAALRRMHDEPGLRARLGAAGREAVKAYTHDAWAAGVSAALAGVGASRC